MQSTIKRKFETTLATDLPQPKQKRHLSLVVVEQDKKSAKRRFADFCTTVDQTPSLWDHIPISLTLIATF